MTPTWLNLKNLLYLIGTCVVILLLIWGLSSWRISSIEKKIAEQEKIVAVKEAEAEMHRKRAEELEQAMIARDQLIIAKDVIIAENSRKADIVNLQLKDEDARYRAELDAGLNADPERLRERICQRFAAARVQAPNFCGPNQSR